VVLRCWNPRMSQKMKWSWKFEFSLIHHTKFKFRLNIY
jgi:hypothetical protein